jgi:hypothetical protein
MLSNDYANFKERTNEITIFAEKIGALVILDIERRKVSENHPDWPRFDKLGGIVVNQFGTNSDFSVTALKCFLSVCTLKKSKLVWRTMRDGDTDRKLHAFFGRNGSYSEYGASSLVHDLRTSRWVPQSIGQNIIFVKPGDAFPEKLPDGFEYQTGWKWIQEIEFAKHAEILREATKLEEEKRTAEYKQKTESASVLGFDSAENGIEAAKLQKDNPDGYRKLMEETYTPKATFPTRSTVNPERRQEKLEQDFDEAPAKQYEKRERSVRVTASAIDKETWLRNMYTNDSNEMICQICKDEMPFRKRNGEHYFEAVEALSKEYFKKEHEAQHLALCPLCSAKYKEFVKGEKDALATLKKELQEAADNEVPLSLGNEKTTLRFVEIHMRDIKQILGTR